jgi:phosphomevalonate kinase
MHLIGISGKKQSGKDEVTSYLLKKFPGSVRIAFADALKQEVARACGVSIEYLNEHKDNFRLILQGWGTDFRRRLYGQDYWIRRWDFLAREQINCPMIICPDVRFPDEAEYILECSGTLWRMDRCRFYGTRRLDEQSTDNHQSEIALDDYMKFDCVIRNHGTIKQLHREVDITLEQLQIK